MILSIILEIHAKKCGERTVAPFIIPWLIQMKYLSVELWRKDLSDVVCIYWQYMHILTASSISRSPIGSISAWSVCEGLMSVTHSYMKHSTWQMAQSSLKCVFLFIIVVDDLLSETFMLMHSCLNPPPSPAPHTSHILSTVGSIGGPLYSFVQSPLCSLEGKCYKYTT